MCLLSEVGLSFEERKNENEFMVENATNRPK